MFCRMRRYADDMSLILWELPLSSLASGFEEIICEGISLLALSHHPPKDTAGIWIDISIVPTLFFCEGISLLALYHHPPKDMAGISYYILCELPLGGPANVFKKIICEGISISAPSRHPTNNNDNDMTMIMTMRTLAYNFNYFIVW